MAIQPIQIGAYQKYNLPSIPPAYTQGAATSTAAAINAWGNVGKIFAAKGLKDQDMLIQQQKDAAALDRANKEAEALIEGKEIEERSAERVQQLKNEAKKTDRTNPWDTYRVEQAKLPASKEYLKSLEATAQTQQPRFKFPPDIKTRGGAQQFAADSGVILKQGETSARTGLLTRQADQSKALTDSINAGTVAQNLTNSLNQRVHEFNVEAKRTGLEVTIGTNQNDLANIQRMANLLESDEYVDLLNRGDISKVENEIWVASFNESLAEQKRLEVELDRQLQEGRIEAEEYRVRNQALTDKFNGDRIELNKEMTAEVQKKVDVIMAGPGMGFDNRESAANKVAEFSSEHVTDKRISENNKKLIDDIVGQAFAEISNILPGNRKGISNYIRIQDALAELGVYFELNPSLDLSKPRIAEATKRYVIKQMAIFNSSAKIAEDPTIAENMSIGRIILEGELERAETIDKAFKSKTTGGILGFGSKTTPGTRVQTPTYNIDYPKGFDSNKQPTLLGN